MACDYDTVIRDGLIVDGSGDEPFEGDIAFKDERIAQIGRFAGSGAEEFDARGKIVTPGFVDLHTHYDGQALWENRLAPSSGHGVTTVVAGNCGVGFAPCRPEDRANLVVMMEGVEDIPNVVMADGLPWNWETFGEYLDVLGDRELDADIATHVPHAPLRVYVMGRRGIDHEPATEADLAMMRQLVADGIRAGAFGVSTSRSFSHRRSDGPFISSIGADFEELKALGMGLNDAGRGVFQLIPEVTDRTNRAEERRVIERLAAEIRRPVSFTLGGSYSDLRAWRSQLEWLDDMHAKGLQIRGQTFPRPTGVLLGLNLSVHPFFFKPTFRSLEAAPLGEIVRRMRASEVRARLLSEPSEGPNPFLIHLATGEHGSVFRLGDPPDYAPPQSASLNAEALRLGKPLDEVLYDALLEEEGQAILYSPGHFSGGDLYPAKDCLMNPGTLIGLGDGGAHYSMICDAAYPSFILNYWVKAAPQGRGLPLASAIRALSKDTADHMGLWDRGMLHRGLKADANIIDMDKIALHGPVVARDLPAGARRLTQKAAGYVATFVSGVATYRDGQPTGALPGRLVRSSQQHRAD